MPEVTPLSFRLGRCVAAAVNEATDLGYDVTQMTITLTRGTLVQGAKNGYQVYFRPTAPVGFAMCGGDLTIDVDIDTGEILEVVRGQ